MTKLYKNFPIRRICRPLRMLAVKHRMAAIYAPSYCNELPRGTHRAAIQVDHGYCHESTWSPLLRATGSSRHFPKFPSPIPSLHRKNCYVYRRASKCQQTLLDGSGGLHFFFDRKSTYFQNIFQFHPFFHLRCYNCVNFWPRPLFYLILVRFSQPLNHPHYTVDTKLAIHVSRFPCREVRFPFI